jgi:hypothetical protein
MDKKTRLQLDAAKPRPQQKEPTMTPKAVISPSIHEMTVSRHMLKDDDSDQVLNALHDAVKVTREMCEKSAQTTEAVMANQFETEPARHRKARDASFALLERGTKALDGAIKAGQNEIKTLKTVLQGPTPTKDPLTEQRQRELRERLALLPKERQQAIIGEAIAHGDDNLVSAILSVPAWAIGGMSQLEQEMMRANWARKHHAPELDRLARIEKAMDDTTRAGQLSLSFVDSLTDAALITSSEKTERAAADALRAVKA